MRVMVLYNPVSGRGHACQSAGAIAEAFLQTQCDVELIPTQATAPEVWLIPALTFEPEAVVVVGGDGTLRQIASALVSSEIPIYHAPSGTENLFATSMGMTADPQLVVASVMQNSVISIDTATANGSFMLLMASVGFDAAIVADLAKHRGESITRMSYVMPFIRQSLRWDPPELTIHVDGECIVRARHGWVIVANDSAYACGSNPARNADISDGELDVLFVPFRKRLMALRWLWRLANGTHIRHSDAVNARGKEVIVRSTSDSPWQIDGDPVCDTAEMDIKCTPASLVVLQQTVTIDDSTGNSVD